MTEVLRNYLWVQECHTLPGLLNIGSLLTYTLYFHRDNVAMAYEIALEPARLLMDVIEHTCTTVHVPLYVE